MANKTHRVLVKHKLLHQEVEWNGPTLYFRRRRWFSKLKVP